jgi:hypothetical protein
LLAHRVVAGSIEGQVTGPSMPIDGRIEFR